MLASPNVSPMRTYTFLQGFILFKLMEIFEDKFAFYNTSSKCNRNSVSYEHVYFFITSSFTFTLF